MAMAFKCDKCKKEISMSSDATVPFIHIFPRHLYYNQENDYSITLCDDCFEKFEKILNDFKEDEDNAN